MFAAASYITCVIASVKQLPKLKKKNSLPSKCPLNLGQVGEQRAALFLQNKGFQVIDRNVRLGKDEIDLVVWDVATRELVFVEVKTRHQTYSGDPSSAIDPRKMRALLRTARLYIKKIWRKWHHFRIDSVAVSPGSIHHTPNITWGMLK